MTILEAKASNESGGKLFDRLYSLVDWTDALRYVPNGDVGVIHCNVPISGAGTALSGFGVVTRTTYPGANASLLAHALPKNYDLVADLAVSASIALPQSLLNW